MREEVGGCTADGVKISRDREKTFRAEEPALGDLWQPARAQRLRQFATLHLDRAGVIDRHIALAAARSVITGERGDAFQQRRLPGAVLADDDGDGALEAKLEIVGQERQAERIGLATGHALRIEPEPLQIRRRQIDVAFLLRHASPNTPGYLSYPWHNQKNVTRTICGP